MSGVRGASGGAAGGPGRPAPDGEVIARLCTRVLADFIADPARNNLGPGDPDPAWEDFLLGFSAGDDPLWLELKTAVGPEHWTPAEAFAAGRDAGAHSVASPNAKQPATPWAALPAAAPVTQGAAPGGAAPAPADLTVISWAVIQTEKTKLSNRAQTRFPSEAWARARVFGQQANRDLHLAMLNALRAEGLDVIAPAQLPAWGEVDQGGADWHSTWSERHVAYVSGLGTFGLSGGLITSKGQAVRFGSLLVRASIRATPRPYTNPFAYCLHFSGDGCEECVARCPAGSVDPRGRDKVACIRHMNVGEGYIQEHYGFAGYGCGLCQTAVPCESGIPEGLHR